jgi:putative ABC transport system permease protein
VSALGKVVRAGVGRRRVQTVVMTLTMLLAVTASVLAAGLLVASRAPFDRAFAAQRGAHLTGQFDGARVSAGQVAATAHLPGVSVAAGPYPVLDVHPVIGTNAVGMPPGLQAPPATLVGRAGPGGPVDDLDLTAGTWATGTGQIVWTADETPFRVGDQVSFPDLPGSPTLTVVGLAQSVGETADAWVSPAELAALTAPGAVPNYQMLYRFAAAATDAQVSADRATIVAAVPAGSMTSAASYLKIKLAAERQARTFAPFVVVLGALGLCMSVLIIGIVIGGTVGAATRRIGILKSLGFTPAQVVRAYLAQALIPAAVGTALGVVLGDLLAVPVLSTTGHAFGTAALSVAPWIDVAVPVAALATVAAAALAPALRAGRLRTVEAIAVGRTPRTGRGRTIRHLLGRLPLPRPVSLGLGHPFTRPARSATLAAAVALGAIGVTFGVGLAASLTGIDRGLSQHTPGQVTVHAFAPSGPSADGPPKPADPGAVADAIGAQPGTRRFFSTGETQVGVAGLAGPTTTVIAYQGDSSWGPYQMISGSWFTGPGQAVVPSGFLNLTGTHLGDTITMTNAGHQAPVRIVGEAFSLSDEGQQILTEAASLAGLGAQVLPESVEFNVDLRPGTDARSYVDSINASLQPLGALAEPNSSGPSGTVVAMDSLAATLTLMLVAVAGLGVLNTVVLDTRDRVHDLGVFKALGMSPKQTIAMVITSVTGIGLLAGVVGVPIGIALHHLVLPAMGRAAGTRIPAADIAVYHLPVLLPLALGGLVIAVMGALLPAGWAARTGTATALRTE